MTLRAGERFTLVEEFVVHRHCQGGTIRIRETARDVRAEIATLQAKVLRLTEERDEARADRRRMATTGLAQSSNWNAERDVLKEQIVRLEQRLVQMVAADLSTPRLSTPGMPPSAPEPEREQISPKEPEDITALRFGLLELD